MKNFIKIFVMFFLIGSACAADEIIIIAHPDVVETSLNKKDIKNIFLMKKRLWKNGDIIKASNLHVNNSLRKAFSKNLLKMSATSVERYYIKRVYEGKGTPPQLFYDTKAMIKYVQSTPGAIGYVSETLSSDSVKIIKIED